MAGTTLISDAAGELRPTASSSTGANAAENDLWIFRDGKKTVSGPVLLSDLRQRIAECSRNRSAVLDALIEAGELEAALADANCSSVAMAARITDALAAALCSGRCDISESAHKAVDNIDVPATLDIAPPEGFTYYALHPVDFANVLARIPQEPKMCAVVGIRSIGTTLSAVVLAALQASHRPATRITVRPHGHPYSRKTEFTVAELEWVRQNLAAQFIVVDEGPGRSGSTFLSVAEALLGGGVPQQNITILGSRQPDVDTLCAENAASRWKEFRFLATNPSVNGRFQDWIYAGGGAWRHLLLSPDEPWPESWMETERLKFISPDGQQLYKFEGMGPIGADARHRAFALADAGFAPASSDAGDGFLAYELLRGNRIRPENIGTALLDRVANYCAFRNANFAVRTPPSSELREMLAFNISKEFGIALSLPEDAFFTDRPLVTDGRMQMHEWVSGGSDLFFKTDGVDHGDNHFFPGPCDIAWDLAGVAVEWQLEKVALEYLMERFRRQSSIDASGSLALYKLAYCVFRLGSCKMAVSTVKGSPEEHRLTCAYKRYRAVAQSLLAGMEYPAAVAA